MGTLLVPFHAGTIKPYKTHLQLPACLIHKSIVEPSNSEYHQTNIDLEIEASELSFVRDGNMIWSHPFKALVSTPELRDKVEMKLSVVATMENGTKSNTYSVSDVRLVTSSHCQIEYEDCDARSDFQLSLVLGTLDPNYNKRHKMKVLRRLPQEKMIKGSLELSDFEIGFRVETFGVSHSPGVVCPSLEYDKLETVTSILIVQYDGNPTT